MPSVYELSVETTFAAAHAITMGGTREPTHGHNWHVTLVVTGDSLDADGLLCDFHLIERELRAITGAWHNRNLNETPPFDRLNPTAELVARHIALTMSPKLPRGVRVESVRVTEAPGCAAVYRGE